MVHKARNKRRYQIIKGLKCQTKKSGFSHRIRTLETGNCNTGLSEQFQAGLGGKNFD